MARLSSVNVHPGFIFVVGLYSRQEVRILQRVSVSQNLRHQGQVLELPAKRTVRLCLQSRAVAVSFHFGTAQSNRVAFRPQTVGLPAGDHLGREAWGDEAKQHEE